jgi:hypothetical protein
MDQEMQDRLLSEFGRTQLDAGLVVDRADIVDNRMGPTLIIHYKDQGRPDQKLAGWWDMRRYDWGLHPDEVPGLAQYAKIWLEELFHAGPPFEDRPLDGDGIRWAEMDTLKPALPPHLSSATESP